MNNSLKTTPLYDSYAGVAGAKLVPFNGWLLPLHFETGIIGEHNAVRNNAGMFDVSHMGEIIVSGRGSAGFLDFLCTNTIESLKPGRIRYTPMCRETGGTVDDLLVYRLEESRFLLVVNAGNTDKVYGRLVKQAAEGEWGDDLSIRNESTDYAQLAVQGPNGVRIVAELAESSIDGLKSFNFIEKTGIAGISCLVSRTGYTGEDGFEIYCSAEQAGELWTALLSEKSGSGLIPCGLGARDTLRLEAGLPLYGHELDETISPVEADLGRFIDFSKNAFSGREVLEKQKNGAAKRKRYGIRMIDKGVPRQGHEVLIDEDAVGFISSGSISPSTGSFIAMGFIRTGRAEPGDNVTVTVNGRHKRAQIENLPFYTPGY